MRLSVPVVTSLGLVEGLCGNDGTAASGAGKKGKPLVTVTLSAIVHQSTIIHA